MKQSKFKVKKVYSLLCSSFILFPSLALAAGLQKAKTTLETFKSELLAITPIVAIIALILLGIAYATNFVEKETFFRWGIGVIIVGSAAQITSMLLN